MNDWVPLALPQPESLEVSTVFPANSIRWMLKNWDTRNLGRLGWKREQFVKALNSMNEPRYAWSEVPGEVVLMPHHMREGENYRLLLPIAKDLHSQLGKAIEQAEQTPFLRWWLGLSVKSIDGSSRYISQESNVSLTKDEAEALFNQIREAK